MSQINNIREGLARLATTVETIANTQAAEMPPAVVNSISGNAIHGGKITLLRSTGVRDNATRTSLLVDDDMITVGNVDTRPQKNGLQGRAMLHKTENRFETNRRRMISP